MADLNILVTGAGTVTAVSVIKGLRLQKEFKVHIVAADMDEFVVGKYVADEFVKIPPAGEPGFIDELLDICRRKRIDMLIPIVDYEFGHIARNITEFKKIGCTSIISNPKTIDICNDKFKTYEFFLRNNINTPRCFTKKDILEKIDGIAFPLFIKPGINGRSSIDSFRVQNQDELFYYIKMIEEPIVQEFIDGEEYTLDGLNDLRGKCIGIVPRIRLETKGGVSVKGKTIYDKNMIQSTKKIVEQLKIIGPFNVQCFKTANRGVVFIEINPRFAGTHPLTVAAGLNSAHLLCKMAKGQDVIPLFDKIHYGISMLRYWNEIFIDEKGERMPLQWTL